MVYLPFIAIDVETANYDCTNICQFGFASFLDGKLHTKDAILVNPECEFEPRFKRIHGITRDAVAHSPTWLALYPGIAETLNAEIVLSHTYFDKDAIGKACLRYNISRPLPRTWVDTCSLARRVWPDMENHKLPTLAEHFAISYRAHDAAEDARCAGEIFLLAVRDSGKTMQQIIKKYSMWWPETETISLRPAVTPPFTPEYRPSTAELKRAKYAQIAADRVAALTPDAQLDVRHMWSPQHVEMAEPQIQTQPSPDEHSPAVHPVSPQPVSPPAQPVSGFGTWMWLFAFLGIILYLLSR